MMNEPLFLAATVVNSTGTGPKGTRLETTVAVSPRRQATMVLLR